MKDFLKNLLGTAISSFAGSFYPTIAIGGLFIVSNAGHLIYEYTLRQNIKNLKLQIELITNDANKTDKNTLRLNGDILKDNNKNEKLIKKENELIKKDLEVQKQTLEKLYKNYEVIFNSNVICEKKLEEFLKTINEIKKEVPDLIEIEK